MEHLLLELREEQEVFGAPSPDGPPKLYEGAIYVEGALVAECDTMLNICDQLLTWGAAFSVFAQNVRKSVEGTAHLLLLHVLKTDILKAPKQFARIRNYVE